MKCGFSWFDDIVGYVYVEFRYEYEIYIKDIFFKYMFIIIKD